MQGKRPLPLLQRGRNLPPRAGAAPACEANGAPGSVRIAAGNPYSRNAASKNPPGPCRVRLLHRLTAQQIATVRIRDGQRIDALPVAGTEPALEILRTTPGWDRRRAPAARCRAACAAASCAPPPAPRASAVRPWCWPRASFVPADPAPARASAFAVPSACAPAVRSRHGYLISLMPTHSQRTRMSGAPGTRQENV